MSNLPQPYTFEVFKDLSNGTYQVAPSMDTMGYRVPVNTKDEPTGLKIPTEQNYGWQWAPYGASDCQPTVIREKINDVPMAGQAVYRLMSMMYGNGLSYFKNSDLDGGNTVVRRAKINEIEKWLKRNRVQLQWLVPQFYNYRCNVSTFSELIFNRRKDYVTGIFHKETEFCRKSIQNPDTLHSDYLYYSADFAEQFGSLRYGQAIPLYNWQEGQGYVDRLHGYKMAMHSYLPTPGMIYYPTPPWIGLFKDKGWMDVSAGVSKIVDSLQRNQMKLVYQILIPVSYFKARYPSWDTYAPEKKTELMHETSAFLEKELTDVDNAGKSITTYYATDMQGNPQGKIEIVAIDDKLKRDSWVPSSNTADAQISQGLGLHPSQLGLAPEGGKMGAGSGSDAREAWNSAINLNNLEQDIVLEPLNWIAEFNGWDVTFFIDHTHHTTTNNQEDGQLPGSATITTE